MFVFVSLKQIPSTFFSKVKTRKTNIIFQIALFILDDYIEAFDIKIWLQQLASSENISRSAQ